MNAARLLRQARSRAGLSQRALATRANVPQPTVARIEAGAVDPRHETLERLLQVCGLDLQLAPRLGQGVDRTTIREMLALTPAERIARLSAEARFVHALDEAIAARHAGEIAR